MLHSQTRPTQTAVPGSHGHIERRDYEYIRQGTANLFVVVESLVGWQHITPTTRRTQQDYAYQLQWLADTVYPHAHILRLVEDNLNIHGPAALYATFPAAEAHRLRQRFEFHATPKHGSWLNMTEIEISIVERNCLSQPVADLETLYRRVGALEAERNAQRCTIHWQFTTGDARTKLHDLYPPVQTTMG